MTDHPAIEATGLTKTYGSTRVLRASPAGVSI